ncbi:diacylglycerol/lipid kinase family protein [Saccharopolyspora rosea]|uniref:Diacylglycerol/lipid kinase family protein n=1 Tax=Saccharopolyspora rosea TaxID=524884 RepID=A0ABW3FWD7_9PSEU|nr:diacylglycerol kinase family protein [Saccharopolyspora rosea]
MRCVLLINPKAGGGLTAEVVRAILGQLRAVCDVRTVLAPDAAAAAAAAAEAVAGGVDVLAVVGGDGMAHLAVQACAESDTALVLIPSGTGNDLARALRLPPHPVVAARVVAHALRRGERRRMDLGRVAGGGWFATVLCAGFDSRVNARANRMRLLRGKHRYDVAVVRELLALHAMPLRIETETCVTELDATLVAIGNSACYGGGIPVCPDADTADGEFDVTVVGRVTRRDFLGILPTLRTGRHVEHPAVRTLRARRVRLGGDNGWLAYADGEPQVRLPLTARTVRGALTVVAPT